MEVSQLTEQVSIWRWAIKDDLDARFARLIGSPDEAFAALNLEMAVATEVPSLDAVEAETEAKFRAMNLPADILRTMLDGFKTMMAEAREDEATEAEEDDIPDDPDGRIGVALASSHMFFDDPYASLDYEEIDRQVDVLLAAYQASISNAVGDDGQDFASFLELSGEQLNSDDAFDVLLENGLDGVVRIWSARDHVYFLSHRQEDKELPIDLEFICSPVAEFAALKAQMH